MYLVFNLHHLNHGIMRYFTFLFLIINFNLIAQDYLPFNPNQPKRFQEVTNVSSNDYFFYQIKTDTIGDSLVFTNYFRKTENMVPNGDYCYAWGPSESPSRDTTFMGKAFVYDTNLKMLNLKNKNNENLTFDLNLALGNSTLFYSNSSFKYYITYTSKVEETVLGLVDSVKYFTVQAYDLTDLPIISDLNGFEIKVGKTVGVIQFFDCLNFPALEVKLELMGQLHPTLGVYQMTYDDAYPWQIGDIVEYLGWVGTSSAHSFKYRYLTITDRIETVDSVKIYYDEETLTEFYGTTQVFNSVFANPFKYEKGKNLIEEPESIMPDTKSDRYVRTGIDSTCGYFKTLSSESTFETFCDSCGCLTDQDGGFGYTVSYKYMESKGMVRQFFDPWGPDYSNSGENLIYSKINGIECGTIYYVGLNEKTKLENRVKVSPNPVIDELHVQLANFSGIIKIIDLAGKEINQFEMLDSDYKINVNDLPSGVYYLKIIGENETFESKFVKM